MRSPASFKVVNLTSPGLTENLPTLLHSPCRRVRLCLGQRQVASKENEIAAVPKLLAVLDLAGCIVTLDAMGCQKKIAAAIRECEAAYGLRLKDNHPVVRQEVEDFFDYCLAHD